jgi:ribosome biogenesis GTPase
MSPSALEALGLDDGRLRECQEKGITDPLGRVARVDRGEATVATLEGVARREIAVDEPVVVGDWVALGADSMTLLDRRTELARRGGPRGAERQVVAANVDLVVILSSVVAQFRVNLLSTFLVMAYDAGAVPLVVLTKADLIDDPEVACRDAASRLGGAEVMAISTTTGFGIDQLRGRIDGHTVVLLGESGVGKSTLTNELCGDELLITAELSRGGQGRHTTTHRELVIIPSGGVVIDTPGVRDAIAADAGRGIEGAFHDVVDVARGCRFTDCSHLSTPGCAVEEAVRTGELRQERVDSYLEERALQRSFDLEPERRAPSPTKGGRQRGSRNSRSDEDED